MESYEKVFGNVDLLKLILEYLDYGEQLRFAQVNEQWRYAYEYYSGNVNYSLLYIFHISYNRVSKYNGNSIIAGEVGRNARYVDDPQLLKDFLVVYADRVRDLTLWGVDKSLYHAFPRKFPNLRSLTTYERAFTRAIYDMCPADLQELNIIDPTVGANEVVDTIKRKMNNLRKLQIIYNGKIISKKLIKICHMAKLEFLKFKMGESAAYICLQAAQSLQQLDIKVWNVECLKTLPLQHLKVLQLGLAKDTDQLFSILTESCAALETLTLKGVKFKNMPSCSLPPKVTHLSFLQCDGLSHSCLKQILTEFQIIKFRSKDTQYTGEFHDFKISSHIQSLEIDFVEMAKFRSAYENNSQLKELIWKTKSVENFTYDGSFNSTPNLQLLEMQQMPAAGALSQLNSLQSLILRPLYGQPEWIDILDLLKHPTLHELSFLYTDFTNMENVFFTPLELGQPPVMPVHTNITRLRLTEKYLQTWMEYWLQLFSTNRQLTLVCLDFYGKNLKFAKVLVNHKNFPRKLKTMDVCCFTIDCERLRRNFEIVEREYISGIYRNLVYHYKDAFPNPKHESLNRIVLSWK